LSTLDKTIAEPEIGAGRAFTVKPVDVIQPVPSVYVIVAVPAFRPSTIPVVMLMFAFDGLLLLHIPPLIAFVSVEDIPRHMLVNPPIAGGIGLTFTVVIRAQPVGIV
jgi:hypothetical protein